MAETSGISWTDATWNPWIGCTRISPACDHCYAADWAKRHKKEDLWEGRLHRTSAHTWALPRRLERQALKDGRRIRCFVASLSDFFDNQAQAHWRAEAWAAMRSAPHVDFLVLTKRPQNILAMLPPGWGQGYPNVALGTTVENQRQAELRVPRLLAVQAALHFLSCEPLLEGLNLREISLGDGLTLDALTGFFTRKVAFEGTLAEAQGILSRLGAPLPRPLNAVGWVIAGGESGPHARPMVADWVRSLREQCAKAFTPFHFKQWGTWLPGEAEGNREQDPIISFPDGDTIRPGDSDGWDIAYGAAQDHRGAPKRLWREYWASGDGRLLKKARAADQHILDGQTHLAVPPLNSIGAPLQ